MPDEKELIAMVQAHLKTLTPYNRMVFISECMTDYCMLCGSEHLPCYCADVYDE